MRTSSRLFHHSFRLQALAWHVPARPAPPLDTSLFLSSYLYPETQFFSQDIVVCLAYKGQVCIAIKLYPNTQFFKVYSETKLFPKTLIELDKSTMLSNCTHAETQFFKSGFLLNCVQKHNYMLLESKCIAVPRDTLLPRHRTVKVHCYQTVPRDTILLPRC